MDKDTRKDIDAIRFLAVDMVQRADSGHPGLPLGAAPMAWVLWTRWLRHNPGNPHWFGRDRFVLSAGHGSALLYALLHLTGYELPMAELKRFRQWGSRTPGHPERELTPGVEVTTGPLGQGFANAVGMAIAEQHLAARYNTAGHAVVDHRTYVLASDGDLMEGVASEAASLAGTLQLGKLTCLYDDNRVTLAAGTDIDFTEDRARRFEAYGWHTIRVDDGNDVEAIDAALRSAHDEATRPSLILVRTHIGFGSPEQDSFKAHGSPLGVDAVAATKRALGWPPAPDFLVPPDTAQRLGAARARGAQEEAAWQQRLDAWAKENAELAREYAGRREEKLPAGWDASIPVFAADAKGLATREASGQVMNAIAAKLPVLFGGSADLDPSTKTALKDLGDFHPHAAPGADQQGSDGGGWSAAGRNLHFGVREHAMGSIVNGLAAHGGFLPYGATFLTFSDYMRPAIRLAALMGLHVVHVFTHDSVGLGEDGPTHQPIEHVAALRAIPRLLLIRPADANETAEAWRVAVATRDRPVLLVLSRQALPTLDREKLAPASGLRQGAYVLEDSGAPQLILIATGSEVALILDAAKLLREEGIAVRCVSMPSWELFEQQSPGYREQVLPQGVRARVAVEAGIAQGWERYVGDAGEVVAMTRFGASAPGDTALREFGFSAEHVQARARAVLAKLGGGATRA